jgi:hypothetical protein
VVGGTGIETVLSAPALAGKYARLAIHPGVFTTRGELEDLAAAACVNAQHVPAGIGYFPDKVISSNLVQ